MAIRRIDEILDKAISTDSEVIPRYDIIGKTGETIASDAQLKLKNPIVTPGTPINKVLLDEMLAASGVATGTSSALALEQEGFVLVDGATIRLKSTTGVNAGATLNINGTGAKYIYNSSGVKLITDIAANIWMELVYSDGIDGYVLTNTTSGFALISKTVLADSTYQIDVSLPSEYNVFKLSMMLLADFKNVKVNIKSNAPSSPTNTSYSKGISVINGELNAISYGYNSPTMYRYPGSSYVNIQSSFNILIYRTSNKMVYSGTYGDHLRIGTIYGEQKGWVDSIIITRAEIEAEPGANSIILLEGTV